MRPTTPIDPARTLDGALGFEIELGEEGRVSGRMPVEDRVRQPWGIVHGGALAAFAESLSGWATNAVVGPSGLVAVGLSNHTSFMRPIERGTVHGEGRLRHRGRTTWVWEIDFTDDDGLLCAVSRMTLAVRPEPPPRAQPA